jgi:hypothetical protein
MKSGADLREEVLGKLEVLRERFVADEERAGKKIQTLIGKDTRDDTELDELQAAVSRHRGHTAAVKAVEEAMQEVRNIRLS